MTELNFTIFSRKSTVYGLDNISPVMLKHLPQSALESLHTIMNNILVTQKFPTTWNFYTIIFIPKPNSNTSIRPIALSSVLCKIFKHMVKSKLDWWLKANSILPINLFALRKGIGPMECLSTFIGNIYHSFNKKTFLVTIFVDIRDAFDCVNISTLISQLFSLHAPPNFVTCCTLFSI